MFDSPILDLVILLSFTYFVSSLILSAINESLSGYFRLRQKNLREGLDKMFFDAEWKVFVRSVLIKSPNIESLMKLKGRVPAYIPAQNFILAILSVLDTSQLAEGKIVSLKDNNDKTILPVDITLVLNTLMNQASLSLSSDIPSTSKQALFEKNLELFYNNTMDRVTGWYKKKIRKILFFTGFILAIALNIDTIKISNDALKDENKLRKTVDNIALQISTIGRVRDSIVIKDSAGGVVFTTGVLDTNKIITEDIAKNSKQLKVYYEKTTGYNLGYKDWEDFKKQWGDHLLIKLLGMLITAFALQFSSTYWFELIIKVVNIRAVGKKPEENTKQQPSK